jgi:hypothetical protein
MHVMLRSKCKGEGPTSKKAKKLCVVPYEIQQYARLGPARLVSKRSPDSARDEYGRMGEWWIEAEPIPGLVWPDGSIAR